MGAKAMVQIGMGVHPVIIASKGVILLIGELI
jgi:hypothetical protein